ncbi:fatty acid elongase [Pseudohyphozyma bogoriensis]|nr:fatty acid elongase [Pseudohyphozyma bogoriensis]
MIAARPHNVSEQDQLFVRTPAGLFKQKLDNLPSLDPIKRGMCTHDEAVKLLRVFFAGPAGFTGLFDQRLHTVAFLQARSSMLFTVILYVAAMHDTSPSTMARSAVLFTELRYHLINVIWPKVLLENYRSVQIVQALTLWPAFIQPADSDSLALGDDFDWTLYGHALRIAVEIGLHREFRQLEDTDLKARYLIRDAQRTWVTCFLADRSWAAQTGRPPLVPEDSLTLGSMAWLDDDIATAEDTSCVALIQLRRLLARPYNDFASRLQELESWKLDWLRPKYQGLCRVGHLGPIYYHYAYLLLLSSQFKKATLPFFEAASQAYALCLAGTQMSAWVLQHCHRNVFTMLSFGCQLCYRLRHFLPMDATPNSAYQLVTRLRDSFIEAGATPPHKLGTGGCHARKLGPPLQTWAAEQLSPEATDASRAADLADPDHFVRIVLAAMQVPGAAECTKLGEQSQVTIRFLMNPWTPLVFGTAYFITAKLLSRYSDGKNRIQGKGWRAAIVAHNLLLCAYSAWTFIGAFWSSFREGGLPGLLHVFCDSDMAAWSATQFPYFSYLFYVSKFYEIVDTAIILLQGKKVGLLQSVVFNSFIHTLMYAFYTCSAMKLPFPRFLKKSLTRLQITQFLVGGSLAASYLFITIPSFPSPPEVISQLSFGKLSLESLERVGTQCLATPAQKAAVFANVGYLIPLTWLFAAFFIKSYNNKNAKVKAAAAAAAAEKNGKKE